MTEAAELTTRLRKRAKEDQACADNSAVVADALSEQMARFEARDGKDWNTYAVRMAVDHRNSVKRDTQYAADLTEAADHIETLESRVATLSAALEPFAKEADAISRAHLDGHASDLDMRPVAVGHLRAAREASR